MSELIAVRQGRLGRITLNRPKALNALTYEMALEMDKVLRGFAQDADVAAVLVEGAGERGLCAGGDIRSIHDARIKGDDLPARFWRDEYIMNAFIARYPKPYIAVMDGIVMGGGVGVSAHGSHRIVTERTRCAMPEVAIGFSPDVGGTWLLAHAPDNLGVFCGLTAMPMNGADAIAAGFADAHVERAQISALIDDLSRCASVADVEAAIAARASHPAPGLFDTARGWIKDCFAFDRVEDIMAALSERSEPEAQAALAAMNKHCPKSLKVALRAIRTARSLPLLEAALQMEYRVSLACIAHPDMVEGIRAVVVDKDQSPRWAQARIEDVSEDIVAGYFAPHPGDEIAFK